MVYYPVQRTVPSGDVDQTLFVSDGSTDLADALRVTALPYPTDHRVTFSMWSISGGVDTEIIVNVLGTPFFVPVSSDWTRCELTVEEPVGTDILITPTDASGFYLHKAQLELGGTASDWVPSPDEFIVGSVIAMTEREVYIGTQIFEIDIANGAEMLHMDENGMVTGDLTVTKKLTSPNMAEKYAGSSVIMLGSPSGIPNTNLKLLPGNFDIRYINFKMESDGEGGVDVVSGSSWDICRYAFGKRTNIKIKALTVNSASAFNSVLPIVYEKNSTYYPLSASDINSIIDADAVLINCKKTETGTAATYTPSSFSQYSTDHMLQISNGNLAVESASGCDIYRMAFGSRTRMRITALTDGTTVPSSAQLAYELDGLYFQPAVGVNAAIFEADALLINHYGSGYIDWSSVSSTTLTPSSFSKVDELRALSLFGGSIYKVVNADYDTYAYAFGQRKTIKMESISSSGLQNVVSVCGKRGSTYYQISTDPIELDEIYINCYVGGKQTLTSDSFSDLRLANHYMSTTGGVFTYPEDSDWDIYKYEFSEPVTLKIADVTRHSGTPSDITTLGYRKEENGTGVWYGLGESNEGNTITGVTDLLINYNHTDNVYSADSVSFRVVSSGTPTYSVSSVTFKQVNSSATVGYSITSVSAKLNPGTSRDYSITQFEYVDDLAGDPDVYETIPELANALNNKLLASDVTVNVVSDVYGDSWFGGMSGIGGLTINGNGHSLVSNMSIYNQNTPVTINNAVIKGSVGLSGCRHICFDSCVLNGNGNPAALYAGRSSGCQMINSSIYNAGILVVVQSGSTFAASDLRGGDSTTGFISAEYSNIMMSGSRPQGNVLLTACLTSPADISSLGTAYGSGTSGSQADAKTTRFVSASGSWTYYKNYEASQGSWYSSNDGFVRQGYLDMGTTGKKMVSGVMWFPRAQLLDLTLRSATLTLTRKSGSGTSGNVDVYLWGTMAFSTGGHATPNAVSYGQIGVIGNGETKEFAIPVSAVESLRNESIGGLMLQVGDNTLKSGRAYSRNYAVFYGAGTEYAPVLKLIGQ